MLIDLGLCQAIGAGNVRCPRCGEPVAIVGWTGDNVAHGGAMLITCRRCYPEETPREQEDRRAKTAYPQAQ